MSKRTKDHRNSAVIANYLGIREGGFVKIVNLQPDLDGAYDNSDDPYWSNSLDGCSECFEGYDLAEKVFMVTDVDDVNGVELDELDLWVPWFNVVAVDQPSPKRPKCSTQTNTPFYKGRKVWVKGQEAVISGNAFFDNNSLFVPVIGSDFVNPIIPYNEVSLYPPPVKKVTVTLNSDYTATYAEGADIVKVGCQEIPVEKVLELAKIINSSQTAATKRAKR